MVLAHYANYADVAAPKMLLIVFRPGGVKGGDVANFEGKYDGFGSRPSHFYYRNSASPNPCSLQSKEEIREVTEIPSLQRGQA